MSFLSLEGDHEQRRGKRTRVKVKLVNSSMIAGKLIVLNKRFISSLDFRDLHTNQP